MSLTCLPSLDQLAADPTKAAGLPLDAVEALLAQTHVVQGALLSRLLAARAQGNGPPEALAEPDRLLTVDEASRRLSVSKDWLYRNAKKMPFAVRPTPGTLRFSLRAIEKFIRQRQGR